MTWLDEEFGAKSEDDAEAWGWKKFGAEVVECEVVDLVKEGFGGHVVECILYVFVERKGEVGDEAEGFETKFASLIGNHE